MSSKFDALIERCNPAFCDNPVGLAGWLGLIDYCSRKPEAVAAFEAETGKRWSPPKNGFECMIDEATGYGESYAIDFAEWVTRTQWGCADDPKSYVEGDA